MAGEKVFLLMALRVSEILGWRFLLGQMEGMCNLGPSHARRVFASK